MTYVSRCPSLFAMRHHVIQSACLLLVIKVTFKYNLPGTKSIAYKNTLKIAISLLFPIESMPVITVSKHREHGQYN